MQAPPSSVIGFLAGPTACGKSALAVEIAARHNLAVISADSMQVYRGMSVGTGVIPPAERRGVPHHLLEIVEPTEDFHAARFLEAANAAAALEHRNGRRSLLVGGTGMWIQSMREGLFPGPGRDETIRQRLREEMQQIGPEGLHARLRIVDPATAAKLSPRDHVRVVRALEVHELTGRPHSDWYEEDARRRAAIPNLLPLIVLDRPRPELINRINHRVDQMMADGWLEEAAQIHALNLAPHAPARKALGYPQLFEVIEGRCSLPDAVERIRLLTRQYAKQQMTWFRAQREVRFLSAESIEEIEGTLGLSG